MVTLVVGRWGRGSAASMSRGPNLPRTVRGMDGVVDEVVHQCPPEGSGVTPCCGCTPFELAHDRVATDPALVTCTGEDRSRPFSLCLGDLVVEFGNG